MKKLVEFSETTETVFQRLEACWNVMKRFKRNTELDIKYNRVFDKWIITIYNVC